MVEDFLLIQLDLSLDKRHFARNLVLNNNYSCDKLIGLIKQTSGKQQHRLLCFCDTLIRTHLSYFQDHFQFFIDFSTDEKHETNKRSLTNMYMVMLKNANDTLSVEQKEQLTTICFTWLLDDSLVATKSNCISCLDLLSKENQWIADELHAIIEQIYPDMPVSFQSRAKKIMERKG